MTRHRSSPSTARFAALAGIAVLTLLTSVAPTARAQSGNGFLFSQPRWSLSVRGGFDRATAGGDIFQELVDTLTLDRNDFSSFTFGGEIGWSYSPRIDIAVGAGYARVERVSEYEEFIGSDDLPINQTTTLSRLPLTATVRAYLNPRGRTIGSLAWVPTRFSPYVGVGGGAMKYEFLQEGEFVETTAGTDEFRIFYDHISSSGWTPTAHGLIGAETSLSPRLALTTEARYGWAKSDAGIDFEGYEPIDLSGLSVTMGFNIRF